jgi:predicted MFS family arabinose efflux permease
MSRCRICSARSAHRLSERDPPRAMMAPGFVLIGGGLLMMRGLSVDSDWTHLLAGMIVAGLGAGLVNVPLATTAVGIVEPARAGMASGMNTTFRHIGSATGVAALGAIVARHLHVATAAELHGGTTSSTPRITRRLRRGRTSRRPRPDRVR